MQELGRKRPKLDLPALSGDVLMKQVDGLREKDGVNVQSIQTATTNAGASPGGPRLGGLTADGVNGDAPVQASCTGISVTPRYAHK